MKKIGIIARRELSVFFNSLMAYIMLITFLGFSGLFTWLFGTDVFLTGQASLQSFFSTAYWTLFFFIPALSMRMIAEEKKSGTLEILLTLPVNNTQVIMGKFLANLGMIAFSILLTLPYYFTISSIGNIDHGAVWCGYLGLLLMSAFYISIGIFASSITTNQITGFLLSLLISLFFHLIFDLLASGMTGIPAEILSYLSLSSHYQSMARGVIDSKDLIYFLSFTAMALYLSIFQIKHFRK
jgi:ABC-2 type transport system permease protein